MSKPGLIYRLAFTNVEQQTVQCDILDASVQIDDGADESISSLTGTDDALHITIDDNNEDKYSPVKAKKCVIKFLNSQSVTLDTFSTGEDNRFTVIVTLNSKIIFSGFLERGDISEPFLYQQNEEVELTAIDGLAFLKDIPLTDDDGDNPTSEHNIIQYIVWCLHKIGSQLNINVVNNLREVENPGMWQTTASFDGSSVTVDPSVAAYFKNGNTLNIAGSGANDGDLIIDGVNLSTGEIGLTGGTVTSEGSGPTITFTDTSTYGNIYALFLDAKTFEDQIGTCINCYDVLTKILGHDCFITQSKGEWWIVRVREFRNDFSTYRTVFDHGGIVQSFGEITFEKAVGLEHDGVAISDTPAVTSFFLDEETNKLRQRPNKFSKLVYNYNFWQEILCNSDFSRGDFIEDLPDEHFDESNNLITDPGDYGPTDTVYTVKSYQTECWTLLKGAGDSSATPDAEAYLKKSFFNDYETARWVVITLSGTSGNPKNYIESSAIPMTKHDKFSFAVDWSTTEDVSGSPTLNQPVASIWLQGDDGSFWKLEQDGGNGKPLWATTNDSDNLGVDATLIIPIDFVQNTSEYKTLNVEVPELPVDGKIRIRLFGSGVFTEPVDDFDVRFSNIQLTYNPYINGSFQKYTGQSNTATQTGEYKPSITDEVFIANSPKKLFKGALLKQELINDTNDYALVDRFYEGQEFFYVNSGLDHLAAYGELQVRAYHNQYRNSDELFQAKCQGLGADLDSDTNANPVDIIHRHFNRDLEPTTNNRVLQLVTHDLNLFDCEWTGTLITNFDNDIGFAVDDYLFRYETK